MRALVAKACEDREEDKKRLFSRPKDDLKTRPKFITYATESKLLPRPPEPAVVHTKAVAVDLCIGPMWSVPVTALDAADVEKHVEKLTCAPKPFMPGAKVEPFYVGFVRSGRLFMPPWYGKLAFPNAIPVRNMYVAGERMRPEVKFSGKLLHHPPQVAAATEYFAHLRRFPDCTPCIVCLPCGYGKTPWFLAMAATLGVVSLMLVHKLPLLDQTIEEARRFLPQARVGYVKSDRVRVEGVDLIVASVQTLHSHLTNLAAHPYLRTLMQRVGFVCMDEGHHTVASTFARVFNTIPAKFRLVLTATPRRKDELMPQLQMIAGPVIFRAFRQVKEVHVVCLEYLCEDHVEQRRGAMVERWKMIGDLVEDETRTAMICKMVDILLGQGRRILIVTPRVAHLDEIADKLEVLCAERGYKAREVTMFVPDPPPKKKRMPRVRAEKTPEAKRARKVTETNKVDPHVPVPVPVPVMTKEQLDAENTAMLHAWEDSGPHGTHQVFTAPVVGRVKEDMKQLERELQFEGLVLVATTQMMEEGISCKKLDTLIDTDNTRDPEQVVGRILRTCPDKRVPLVVDLWHDMLKGSFYERLKHYKAEDFELHRQEASAVEDLPPPEFWEQFDRPAPLVM